MANFGYINENNPIAIGDSEAQTMINCKIDKGYLEYCSYDVDEKVPVPNRIIYLPNGREVKVHDTNDSWTGEGFVKWRKKDSEDDWERPSITISSNKSRFNEWVLESAAAEGIKGVYIPQMAGQYAYCVTVFKESTKEESEPFYFPYVNVSEEDVGNKNGVSISIKPIPDYNSSDYTYRFYRMPIGGTTYNYIYDHTGVINPDGETFFDPMSDEDMGYEGICDTTTDSLRPYEMPMRCIGLFDDKMWIGGKDTDANTNKDFGILYYSKTGSWTAFPAANFFTFPSPVVGISTYDQQLIVLTEKSVYYIYGDPDMYSMKMIDYKFNGIVQNSGQALGSFAYFLALDDLAEPDKPRGLFLFNGSVIADISLKICKEFPAKTTFKNWVLDNRYFIFELFNSDNDVIRLVYDTIGGGFSMVNNTVSGFRYRTKEFSSAPNGKHFLKKLYIRAKGTYIVYVVINGRKVLTKHRHTSAQPEDHYLYIKPNRWQTFSLVFEGNEGSEIYDWSLVE